MDLFCEYINDFVEEHMKEMAEYYSFENHWVVSKENSVKIFFHFFSWATSKRYITYRINMSQGEKLENPEEDSEERDEIDLGKVGKDA